MALDAAVLGANCHVTLDPSTDHYRITRALDCRTNASNSLTLSGDREDADAIWLKEAPPRTMVMRPLQRNYVDGRAGTDLITQTDVTDETMRVHQPRLRSWMPVAFTPILSWARLPEAPRLYGMANRSSSGMARPNADVLECGSLG